MIITNTSSDVLVRDDQVNAAVKALVKSGMTVRLRSWRMSPNHIAPSGHTRIYFDAPRPPPSVEIINDWNGEGHAVAARKVAP